MNEKMMLIVGQVFIVVLALILAFQPRLYLVAIIAYFALIFGVSMFRARRGSGGASREEVLQSRTLFKEDKALELALEDEEYVKAMSRQAKAMMIPLLLFPLYILIFRYVPNLQKSLEGSFSDPRLAAFLVWLAAFEAMFLLNQVVRKVAARDGAVAPLVPGGYRVTDKGIVFKGGFGQIIGFPLPEGSEVRLNAERNYVEIRLPRSAQPIRLYSRRARRLYEILARRALGGTEDKGSGSAARKE